MPGTVPDGGVITVSETDRILARHQPHVGKNDSKLIGSKINT